MNKNYLLNVFAIAAVTLLTSISFSKGAGEGCRQVFLTSNTELDLKSENEFGGEKPASIFGGFRKKTITTKELLGSALSLVPKIPMAYRVWVKKVLDAGFREELMLTVARMNNCRFCTWGHEEWAHMEGVSNVELAQLEQMNPESFDRRKWLAISYVKELVTSNFEGASAPLLAEMRQNYSKEEINEIDLVAKVMDIGNRGANTMDALVSRLRGKPASGSHVFDEAVLSATFATVAPIVIVFLAHKSKRPVLEVAKSMLDYANNYEKNNPIPPEAYNAKD